MCVTSLTIMIRVITSEWTLLGYYVLHELGGVTVAMTSLVSDSVHVGPAYTNG
jgi:hypothetical protein